MFIKEWKRHVGCTLVGVFFGGGAVPFLSNTKLGELFFLTETLLKEL